MIYIAQVSCGEPQHPPVTACVAEGTEGVGGTLRRSVLQAMANIPIRPHCRVCGKEADAIQVEKTAFRSTEEACSNLAERYGERTFVLDITQGAIMGEQPIEREITGSPRVYAVRYVCANRHMVLPLAMNFPDTPSVTEEMIHLSVRRSVAEHVKQFGRPICPQCGDEASALLIYPKGPPARALAEAAEYPLE